MTRIFKNYTHIVIDTNNEKNLSGMKDLMSYFIGICANHSILQLKTDKEDVLNSIKMAEDASNIDIPMRLGAEYIYFKESDGKENHIEIILDYTIDEEGNIKKHGKWEEFEAVTEMFKRELSKRNIPYEEDDSLRGHNRTHFTYTFNYPTDWCEDLENDVM